jgi:hypothetical protein
MDATARRIEILSGLPLRLWERLWDGRSAGHLDGIDNRLHHTDMNYSPGYSSVSTCVPGDVRVTRSLTDVLPDQAPTGRDLAVLGPAEGERGP